MKMAAHPMMLESVWFDKCRTEDAERHYHEKLASQHAGLVVESSGPPASSIVSEIARARQNIQTSLRSDGVGLSVGVSVDTGSTMQRLDAVEKENKLLREVTADLRATVSKLLARVTALEKSSGTPQVNGTREEPAKPATVVEEADDDDDDDFDFDDSDDEDAEEVARLKAERLAAYAAKKAKKTTVVAKSNIILDVKPWDDETKMDVLEKAVREIATDGLLWGTGKLVPVAYGIKKLQISCVVEDDKVGTDFLEEQITALEEYVQSMDVVAFNKI